MAATCGDLSDATCLPCTPAEEGEYLISQCTEDADTKIGYCHTGCTSCTGGAEEECLVRPNPALLFLDNGQPVDVVVQMTCEVLGEQLDPAWNITVEEVSASVIRFGDQNSDLIPLGAGKYQIKPQGPVNCEVSAGGATFTQFDAVYTPGEGVAFTASGPVHGSSSIMVSCTGAIAFSVI